MKVKVAMRKVRLDSGGYAPNGRYFGIDLGSGSIYRWSVDSFCGEEMSDRMYGHVTDGYVRDRTRDGAKGQVRNYLDGCDVRFFG